MVTPISGMHAVAYLVCLLVCTYPAVPLARDKGDVPTLSVHQVEQMLGKPGTKIIDVRKYRNWWRSSKKILSAVREDPSKVDQWVSKYAKDKTLILYCD